MPYGHRVTRRSLLATAGTAVAASIAGCSDVLDSDPVTEDWDTTLPLITGSIAVADGHVWAATDDGLFIYDAGSGDETGRNGHINDPTHAAPVVSDGQAFYGTTVENTVYAVDSTGSVEWSKTLDGSVSSCAVTNGNVITATYGSEPGLYALDSDTGDQLWSVALDDHPVYSSPKVRSNRVYLESGGFAAFTADSGDTQWRNETGDTGEVGETPRHRPAVGRERVFYADSRGSGLVAIDIDTGEEEWRHDTAGERMSTPLVSDSTVFVGKNDPRNRDTAAFYALDADTGDELWTSNPGEISLFGPAVTDSLVLTGSAETLYAFDRGSGELEWERDFDVTIHRPIAVDERVFVTGYNSSSTADRLFALYIE